MNYTKPVLPPTWEDELQGLMLHAQSSRNQSNAYVCSPCRAESEAGVMTNMRAARLYMYYAVNQLGLRARAPHAWLPLILSDKRIAERALALRFGLQLLETNELMLVCGNRISFGMHGEIEKAAELGCKIRVFSPELFLDVKKIVTRSGGDKRLVELDDEHSLMAMSPEQLLE